MAPFLPNENLPPMVVYSGTVHCRHRLVAVNVVSHRDPLPPMTLAERFVMFFKPINDFYSVLTGSGK